MGDNGRRRHSSTRPSTSRGRIGTLMASTGSVGKAGKPSPWCHHGAWVGAWFTPSFS